MKTTTYPVAHADDVCNVIVTLANTTLLAGSCETLKWPDLLVKVGFHHRQLSRQFLRVNIKQLQFLGVLREDWGWRRRNRHVDGSDALTTALLIQKISIT